MIFQLFVVVQCWLYVARTDNEIMAQILWLWNQIKINNKTREWSVTLTIPDKLFRLQSQKFYAHLHASWLQSSWPSHLTSNRLWQWFLKWQHLVSQQENLRRHKFQDSTMSPEQRGETLEKKWPKNKADHFERSSLCEREWQYFDGSFGESEAVARFSLHSG